MNGRRGYVWGGVLAVAGAIYLISVFTSGSWDRNGAWLLMVIVIIAAGCDALTVAIRGRNNG